MQAARVAGTPEGAMLAVARAAEMPVEVKAAGMLAAARGVAMAEETAAGMLGVATMEAGAAARAGDRVPSGWPSPLNHGPAVMNDLLSSRKSPRVSLPMQPQWPALKPCSNRMVSEKSAKR
jgi:hypothetical protein